MRIGLIEMTKAVWSRRRLRQRLLTDGARMERWPEEDRILLKSHMSDPAMVGLLAEAEALDRLLRAVVVPEAPASLETKVLASWKMRPVPTTEEKRANPSVWSRPWSLGSGYASYGFASLALASAMGVVANFILVPSQTPEEELMAYLKTTPIFMEADYEY